MGTVFPPFNDEFPNCWTGAMGQMPYCIMIVLKNWKIEREFWESIDG